MIYAALFTFQSTLCNFLFLSEKNYILHFASRVYGTSRVLKFIFIYLFYFYFHFVSILFSFSLLFKSGSWRICWTRSIFKLNRIPIQYIFFPITITFILLLFYFVFFVFWWIDFPSNKSQHTKDFFFDLKFCKCKMEIVNIVRQEEDGFGKMVALQWYYCEWNCLLIYSRRRTIWDYSIMKDM